MDFNEAKNHVIEEFEKSYLTEALNKTNGNVTKAAELVGKERRAFGKLLNPYGKDNPRYVRSMEEQIEDVNKLTLDDVKKFYKNNFGASEATLTVVGDFDEELINKTVNK